MTIVRTRGNTAKVGISGQDRHLENVIAGTNVSIDYSDPLNPVISSTGGGSYSYTFSNGLTESGGTVKLGGSLTEDIAIIPDGDYTRSFNFGDATHNFLALNLFSDLYFKGYTEHTGPAQFNSDVTLYGDDSGGTQFDISFLDAGLNSSRINAQWNQLVFKHNSNRGILLNNTGFQLTLGSDDTGDTYYRNSSGYLTRLAAGTNGHVLTLAAGIPTWAAPSGGSGITIGSTSITGGTSGRLLTSGSTVGEQTLGTGVSTWLSTPSWTNFQSAITGTSPYLPLTGATYTTTTGDGLALTTSTLTSGNLVSLTSTSTAAASNTNTLLNISSSGANATSTQTVTGAKISVTNTGTSATNDALTVSSSGGTTNNAIKVSGGNIVLSQAANQSILKSGGILTVGVSDFNTLSLAVQNTNRIIINGSSGAFTFTTNAVSSGAITPYSFNDFARTNQTASTETNFVNWTPNTTQYATGAQTILRTYRMNPAAYSFVGASTITDAYTLWVDDPVASTNATITNNWAAGFQGNVQIAGLLALGASASGSSSFRIPHGTAPSSPVDGDIWTTTAGLYVRINGSTVGPLT